jgi:hypothetical protein
VRVVMVIMQEEGVWAVKKQGRHGFWRCKLDGS